MQFKNDKERRKFLDNYRDEASGWKLWKSDEEMERRWWRNDMPAMSLVVEEELRTYMYPAKHSEWVVLHWYALGAVASAEGNEKDHFGDCSVGKTAVMGALKSLKPAEGGA